MTLIDKQDIIIIRTMLHKAGLSGEEEKESLVEAYSNNRTKSTKGLLKSEAKELIAHLRRAVAPQTNPKERGQKMKNKIFSMAHEMGWRKAGTFKLDMDKLNAWCIKSSIGHKKLDDYEYNELPALVTQFEQVYTSFLKGVR